MSVQNQHLDSIEDIKNLMNKSSRFISLSGWSGIAAGVCALIAAVIAYGKINHYRHGSILETTNGRATIFQRDSEYLIYELLWIAIATFIAALCLAFIFTYIRSRKTGVPIWGFTARRLMVNVMVPIIVGGLLILRMMTFGFYELISPACLFFYGLALINASKFTLSEIRYLGYCELLLGAINLWILGHGLLFWAIGFGILHIIYGVIMWNRYERNNN
jgi:hypothetical protein